MAVVASMAVVAGTGEITGGLRKNRLSAVLWYDIRGRLPAVCGRMQHV
jgi:hypothetical protein